MGRTINAKTKKELCNVFQKIMQYKCNILGAKK